MRRAGSTLATFAMLLWPYILAPSCKPGTTGPAIDPAFQMPLAVPIDRRFDDQARFLAGLQGRPGSPFRALESWPEWQTHASRLARSWQEIQTVRYRPLKNWAREQVAGIAENEPVFYPFSGPDTPSVFSIYPQSNLYFFTGLERPGEHIDLAGMNKAQQLEALIHIQKALSDLFIRSYFITSHMLEQLQQGAAEGAVPVMNLFLARQGYFIRNVFDMKINSDGTVKQAPFGSISRKKTILLVRIVLTHEMEPERNFSILYLRANLADEIAKKQPALQNFLEKIPPSRCFLKSAAYMLHAHEFEIFRNRVLTACRVILQDDSGIALRFFDPEKWRLTAFGTYRKPIADFSGWTYQPDLAQFYQSNTPAALPFNMGYHWEAGTQNMQLAIRR